MIEVGPSQSVIGARPRASAVTRPEAMAPKLAPRKKGVTTEERAKTAPNSRRPVSARVASRNANPDPRSTIPAAASAKGKNRAEVIAPKARGNPVQSTTSAKISQTLFASQTGAIAWSMRARARAPRCAPPAVTSQKPAP